MIRPSLAIPSTRAAERRPAWSARLSLVPWIVALVLGVFLIGQAALIPAKAALAQVLLNVAFERSIASGAAVRPWPWADSTPIARISVPRLNYREVVLSGGSGEAMAFGPTLMPGSSSPGQPGTSVFAAHRDTHFRVLKDLHKGDLIIVQTTEGTRYAFQVASTGIVRYDQFGIDRRARPGLIALTTCWPFSATQRGPWRYVVTARRVS